MNNNEDAKSKRKRKCYRRLESEKHMIVKEYHLEWVNTMPGRENDPLKRNICYLAHEPMSSEGGNIGYLAHEHMFPFWGIFGKKYYEKHYL